MQFKSGHLSIIKVNGNKLKNPSDPKSKILWCTEAQQCAC